jgi:hypothetical protein
MEEEEGRVGAFGDRVEDFKHLEKTVVWLQLGADSDDDDLKEPARIEITSEDNLFDKICKLHPFRSWGVKVFARRRISKNKRGRRVTGLSTTVYERGWSEAWTRHNFANLQTWLLEHPSREECYITMVTPRNLVDEAQLPRPSTAPAGARGDVSVLLRRMQKLNMTAHDITDR